MKKSLFKLASYIFPKKNVLPLRASAFTNKLGNSCILIGLPGSGKGSLSIRAQKKNLISNDELGWTPSGI
jgi:phosphoenolpyruvate carboxykinase (ATP)